MWMRLSVGGDFFENLANGRRGLPLPAAARRRSVEHHPRNIELAIDRLGRHRVLAEALATPIAELPQRHRRRRPAGKIRDALHRVELGRGELTLEHRHEVARMEAIAN